MFTVYKYEEKNGVESNVSSERFQNLKEAFDFAQYYLNSLTRGRVTIETARDVVAVYIREGFKVYRAR